MFRGFLYEELKKWLVKGLFLAVTTLGVFLFTPVSEKMKKVWTNPENTSAALERLEVSLARLNEKVDVNTALINDILGNNRVIRQPDGLSYVREPVSVGEDVTLFYVIQRTEFGRKCNIKSVQSLFKDSVERILLPGKLDGSPRNAGEDLEEFLVTVTPPEGLAPGRVEVYLVLEYECDYKTVFDRTDVLSYRLKE